MSRWYAPGEVNETGRLVSLAVATFFERRRRAKAPSVPRRGGQGGDTDRDEVAALAVGARGAQGRRQGQGFTVL